MNEVKNNLDISQNHLEQHNNWDKLTFERQIKHELSLEEKQELIDYFRQHDGKTEFDGYRMFVSEVSDHPELTLQPEQLLVKTPNICYLGNHCLNGFDPNDDFLPKNALEGIDYQATPVAFADNTFTHLRFFGSHAVKTDREIAEENYCRFYICPELESIPEIIPKLVEKYQARDLRLTAKFANTNKRNDRMIIYSDQKSASSQLEAIEELKAENPELFQNLGKNRLWGEIEEVEGIYYGQENPYNIAFSYSEDRAVIVGASALALDSIVKNGTQLNDEIVAAVFDLATLGRKVDPNSWSEYIRDEDREQMAEQAEDILYAITDPEELEYIGEEVDFSKFTAIFSGLRFLLEPEKRRQYVKKMNK